MAEEKKIHKQPYAVGITGGSASGKTSFLARLKDKFTEGEISVISLDDYYKPIDNQVRDAEEQVNFDLPDAFEIEAFMADIEKLRNNKLVQRKEYTFNNPLLKPQVKITNPAPIIVVEGLFLFYFEEVRKMLDLKLFIEVREDIKFSRRLERDENERGIPLETILYQWNEHVYPAYRRFVLPYRDDADIVIHNNVSFDKGLNVITNHLKSIINE